jgi:hypothetical protein
MEIIRPTQCAVFVKDRLTSAPLSPEGQPFRSSSETTCLLFDTIAEAQQFCEAKVLERPNLCAEVFDAAGRAHPPLLVITHPGSHGSQEAGPVWSRRRKLIAVVLLLAAPPLIWIDWRRRNTLILPTFLAFNCILAGLRFLYWDFGLKLRERERQQRLEAHRRLERDGS